MKKFFAILSIILLTASLQAGEFVNMITPAESLGKGSTFVGDSGEANSMWLNPAGLATSYIQYYSIGASMWNATISPINLFMGSAVFPLSFGTVGAGLGWLGMESEEYEDAAGFFTGQQLDFNNIAASIGYGRELSGIPLGLNLKFINSSFGMENKFLILSDIGVMYHIWKINPGLMLRNFGIVSHDSSDWGEFRAGFSWDILSKPKFNAKLNLDYYMTAYEDSGVNVGLEMRLFRMAFLRMGYHPGKYNALQFGTGFAINISKLRMKLDYSINPALDGLDMSHFSQITINSRTKEIKGRINNLTSRADEYTRSGDYEKAEVEIDKALELNPEDKKLITLRNEIITKKNKKKAAPHLEKAKDLKRIKNYKSAMEILQKALELDGNFEEAKKLQDTIISQVEKKKPKWIKEDKYYTKARLVFEDFNEEAILPKFVAVNGEFSIKKDGENGFSQWKIKGIDIDEDDENKEKPVQILRSTVRLPDLSKFKGILISLKSGNIKQANIVLVESAVNLQNEWELLISGIEDDW